MSKKRQMLKYFTQAQCCQEQILEMPLFGWTFISNYSKEALYREPFGSTKLFLKVFLLPGNPMIRSLMRSSQSLGYHHEDDDDYNDDDDTTKCSPPYLRCTWSPGPGPETEDAALDTGLDIRSIPGPQHSHIPHSSLLTFPPPQPSPLLLNHPSASPPH